MNNVAFQRHLSEVQERVRSTDPVVPAQRLAYRKGYTISAMPFEALLPAWHYTWKNSDNFFVRLQAFFFLEQHVAKKEQAGLIWDTAVTWQEEITDWALCDSLAKIYTKVLEQYPEKVYPQLVAWAKDSNPWKRRQSVVSLLYFSRTKKVYLPFQKIAALIDPLLTDKEYYVQKGVGWALREMHTVYAADTLLFLQKHIKSISAIAFTISIEKIDINGKAELKSLRKKISYL